MHPPRRPPSPGDDDSASIDTKPNGPRRFDVRGLTATRQSRVGSRAEQARRERKLALRLFSLLGLLTIVAIALGSLTGWASPWTRTQQAASLAKASPSARPARTNKSPALTGKAHTGSAVASSIAMQVVAVPAAKPMQVASSGGGSGVDSTGGSGAKPVASGSASARRAVASSGPGSVDSKRPASAVAAGTRVPSAVAARTVTIESFGYDFGGPPAGSRLVADVRNIDAGNFTQQETGLMPSVRARVMATSAARTWLAKMDTSWAPALKNHDLIAIGCARGHHRSVTLAVIFASQLRARGFTVDVINRDIHKTW